MGHVLEKDAHMRHGFASGERFIHVRLKGELLNVAVFTDTHEALTSCIAAIPETLHDPQHPEHFAVITHEAFARRGQGAHIAGTQAGIHCISGQRPAQHGVINALAGSRCDDARRVTATFVAHYNDVRLHSAIGYVPPRARLEGRDAAINEARDTKLAAAREARAVARQCLRTMPFPADLEASP